MIDFVLGRNVKKGESLSDKIVVAQYKRFKDEMLPIRYVREAIKKLKEEIESFKTPTYNFKFLDKIKLKIDKLFGGKLI